MRYGESHERANNNDDDSLALSWLGSAVVVVAGALLKL